MPIKNKVILFYNHRSGNGMFKNNLDKIIARYQDDGKLVIPIRAADNSLTNFFESMNKETYLEEYCQVLVAGGDGTINICVNAMINNEIDLPLGILPAGTANDFAYYFEIPSNIDKMLDITLGGKSTYADVGVVNGRYFINVAAMGQVVDVSQKTDPVLKNSIGVLAYYLKGISELTDLKPIKVKLTTDNKVYDEKMYFMVVMNGKSAGGFKMISPTSEINDGLLDLVAGGDGTINICVNAMINNEIDLPLGILPAGTANDFAYYFEIPSNIDKMLDITLGGKSTYADVGVVNGRYFINVAAMGQVVDVSQKTDPVLKNSIGVLAYYLKGISELTDLKPIKVKLTTDNKVYDEKMYFMVVMNGKSAGGFKMISPTSEINDGLLDVILFRPMNVFEMPKVFMKILQGKHSLSRKVLHFKTSYLKIESDIDIPTDIDGEHGQKLPLTFSILHKKLRIMTAEEDMGNK